MKWINSLKIAIIEENITEIGVIIENLPEYGNKEDAQEALALLDEAKNLVKNKKNETLTSMNKIKQTKVYLDNT